MFATFLEGSLSSGLVAKSGSVDAVFVGQFICVDTPVGKLFGVIFDLEHKALDVQAALSEMHQMQGLFAKLFVKHNFYTLIKIAPLICYKQGTTFPVRVLPPTLSPINKASDQDFCEIFGQEDFQNRFCIGFPVDSQAQVCIDLQKFSERSNGIFGKTGTGKTFVTRLMLAGLMRSGSAVNLIFDMHGEYGLQARSENKSQGFVKGLKSLFGDKVAIFSLDPQATIQKGCQPDEIVSFSWADINIDDIILLQSEFNLHPTAVEAANLLFLTHGKRWLETLLNSGSNLKELAQQIGAHTESLSALYRKLKRLENFAFISNQANSKSILNTLIEHLERGIHVVLEFGRQSSTLCYLLVASILTRKIHRHFVQASEKYFATQKPSDKPRQLIITIEEAHKFLNPYAAKQTIFGMIAREMRKYFVSLLIVDQRPSGVCDEVLSQLGTKLVCRLEDEKDLSAVLCGAANQAHIKSMLQSLAFKQQLVCFGHAIPIPMILSTRPYDQKFYSQLQEGDNSTATELIEQIY